MLSPANFRGAGQLIELVAFDQREEVDDGAGNTVGTWIERFQRRAAFVHMRGGEAVMAARLEAREPMLIRIRDDPQARQIFTDWQVRDVRRGKAYNIREVTNDNSREWIEILAETGVATG